MDTKDSRRPNGRSTWRGERKLIGGKVPIAIATEIEARAKAAEVTVTDYLITLLSRHVAEERGPEGNQPALDVFDKEAAMTG